MYFQIRKVILWPRGDFDRREIEFVLGSVNVISGGSKTGKSAVIPIIDYCLGSKRCAIPVGVIRDTCEWFGVLIETAEGEKLFARREPGEKQQTGDMYFVESAGEVDLPVRLTEKNANVTQVKETLNRLSGLSNLGMMPHTEGYKSDRTSFRDLMAFTFQPQNVIANPDVLFFKADTTEHREKLKAVFPYVLNAVTEEILAARWELDRLTRLLRQKETAMNEAKSSVNIWIGEASAWISQAIELGLHPDDSPLLKDWDDVLEQLRKIAGTNFRDAKPSIAGLEGVLKELAILQDQEGKEALTLSVVRQRLHEVRRLIDSSENFGGAINIQRDRLALSSWFRQLSKKSDDTLTQLLPETLDHLDALCSALEGLEIEAQSQIMISDKLDKEQLRLRTIGEESIARLNVIRQQINELERRSKEARDEAFRADSIERYLGRLEQALKLYEKAGANAELQLEIDDLSEAAYKLRTQISENVIRQKETRALANVESIAGQIVPNLDAEWPNAAIKFIKPDLTLKILQGVRDDYLWEIGSGANWLAYHLSISLAFQRFFLQTPQHPVPSFLIYDQPSQAYFPRTVRSSDVSEEVEWKDEDVIAVRKVFSVVSNEVAEAAGRLQIIVLDHADTKVWGDIENVALVEEWRDGKRLVPQEWLSN